MSNQLVLVINEDAAERHMTRLYNRKPLANGEVHLASVRLYHEVFVDLAEGNYAKVLEDGGSGPSVKRLV